MGLVSFLNHRAQQTGELRQRALQDRDAEIHVTQQPLEGVAGTLVRRSCKQGVGHPREMGRGGQRQLFLAVEVVEEAALGELGGLADVLDASRRIALCADDMQRRVEEPDLGAVLCFGGGHGVPSSRWQRTN